MHALRRYLLSYVVIFAQCRSPKYRPLKQRILLTLNIICDISKTGLADQNISLFCYSAPPCTSRRVMQLLDIIQCRIIYLMYALWQVTNSQLSNRQSCPLHGTVLRPANTAAQHSLWLPLDGKYQTPLKTNKSSKLLVAHLSIQKQKQMLPFLRATAVPPGTAEARISYGNSVCPSGVCLSVRHDPVRIQCQVR